MKSIPVASMTGTILSVSEKPVSEKNKTAYRLIVMSQIGEDGDARNIEIKSYNGAKVELHKVMTLTCRISSWAMKGDRGDIIGGITATLIEKETGKEK